MSSQAIGFRTGFHFSSMKELRDLNLAMLDGLPFDTKIVSDFPGYWFYEPYIKLENSDISFGISYLFTTTGSRISGVDYSGEYRLDMIVRNSAPIFFTDFLLQKKDNLQISLKARLGMLFSGLNINENLTVDKRILIKDNYDYRSTGFLFLPDFRIAYLWHSFGFAATTGYLIQFGTQDFHLKDNSNSILTNTQTGNSIGPNWNGIQVGISIYYSMK